MKKYSLFLFLLMVLAACSAGKVSTYNKSKPIARTTKTASSPKKSVPAYKKTTSNEVIKSTSTTTVTSKTVVEYINQFKATAIHNMKTYGIPASIILAQGILESGAGNGKLAQTANNHFGIKCSSDWNGEKTYHDDDASQECFRVYKNASESYLDHAAILSKRSRYATLFTLEKTDYQGWAKGLKAAGYATDPKYPEKLIGYIERYQLQQYDSDSRNTDAAVDNSNKHLVAKGDTLYSISKKYTISVENLILWNTIENNTLSIGQLLKIKQ